MNRKCYSIPTKTDADGSTVYPALFGNEGSDFSAMTKRSDFNAADGFEIAVFEDGTVYDHVITLYGLDPWR